MRLKQSFPNSSRKNHPKRQFSQLVYEKDNSYFRKLPGYQPNASHVSTAFINGNGSLSQAYLALDIDFEKTESIWHCDGKISYQKIKCAIDTYMPFLKETFVAASRSSGGRGIHLVFAVSPFLIDDERFEITQKMFLMVNRLLVRAFDDLGIGADSMAVGTNRLTMNWLNKSNLIEHQKEGEAGVWSRSSTTRRPVLTKMLKELKNHPLVVGRSKKEICQTVEAREVLLYPHEESEPKVAKLYEHVFTEHGGQWEASISEISELCGLDPQTIRKIKNLSLACGLEVEKISHGEWRVTTRIVDARFSRRIHQLLEADSVPPKRNEGTNFDLIPLCALWHPSEVDPGSEGERNQWLTSASVWLKICGVVRETATHIIDSAIEWIPEAALSKKCRQGSKIVDSIYRNRTQNFGKLDSSRIPNWLIQLKGSNPLTTNEKGQFPSKKPSEARRSLDRISGEFWLGFQQWVEDSVPESERELIAEFLMGEGNRDRLLEEFSETGSFSLSWFEEAV